MNTHRIVKETLLRLMSESVAWDLFFQYFVCLWQVDAGWMSGPHQSHCVTLPQLDSGEKIWLGKVVWSIGNQIREEVMRWKAKSLNTFPPTLPSSCTQLHSQILLEIWFLEQCLGRKEAGLGSEIRYFRLAPAPTAVSFKLLWVCFIISNQSYRLNDCPIPTMVCTYGNLGSDFWSND